jgi:hypothetical protein
MCLIPHARTAVWRSDGLMAAQFRFLHLDRTPCPGIMDCERCTIEWFLTGGLRLIKEPVDGTLDRHDH